MGISCSNSFCTAGEEAEISTGAGGVAATVPTLAPELPKEGADKPVSGTFALTPSSLTSTATRLAWQRTNRSRRSLARRESRSIHRNCVLKPSLPLFVSWSMRIDSVSRRMSRAAASVSPMVDWIHRFSTKGR